ncbi:Hypothetical protein A7982_01862 [Minicystis rosea]|nr:Hypothetical protein A7982_01862 [Minicystis rosea]
MKTETSNKMRSLFKWALPGIVFSASYGFAACSESLPGGTGDCPPGTGGQSATTASSSSSSSSASSSSGTTTETTPGGTQTTSEDPDNTFDHFNDPGASGSKDPFEILKERALEGPPEVRTRLHSCTKIAYASLGEFLKSRGVNLNATSTGNGPKTAGELYKGGADALGVAKFDAREGETFFHTTASATKLFDIFVQAAPEVIANIQNMDACKYNGVSKPMFDTQTGKCVYESLSCVMGRPATQDDLTICNLLVEQATPNDQADLAKKRNIAVAVFLSASHTCE